MFRIKIIIFTKIIPGLVIVWSLPIMSFISFFVSLSLSFSLSFPLSFSLSLFLSFFTLFHRLFLSLSLILLSFLLSPSVWISISLSLSQSAHHACLCDRAIYQTSKSLSLSPSLSLSLSALSLCYISVFLLRRLYNQILPCISVLWFLSFSHNIFLIHTNPSDIFPSPPYHILFPAVFASLVISLLPKSLSSCSYLAQLLCFNPGIWGSRSTVVTCWTEG